MTRSVRATLVLTLAGTLVLAAITIGASLALFTVTFSVGSNDFASDTLNPPTGLTATGGHSVTLNWTASVDTYANGHKVYRGTSAGGPYSFVADVTPASTTTYNDSPADGTYYYVLKTFYQNWLSADSNEASATKTSRWYLHNNPTPPTADTTSQLDLPLDQTAPTATTLYNYDTDRDSAAGLLLTPGVGATETDPNRYQAWRTAALGSSLRISTVNVTLWSGMKDFGTAKQGSVTVFLRDYNGASYTEICNGTLTDADWQGGSGTWVEKTISFTTDTCANYTIPAGNFLEVKLIVNSSAADDMWFAYDTTSYGSRVELPDPPPDRYLQNNPTPPTADTASQADLPLGTTAPTAATLYNYDTDRDGFAGLRINRIDRWYLHNNPTPPTGDTMSQADLPLDGRAATATTLYNYDTDKDGLAGRVLVNGAGVTETDLAKYQNWRTTALGAGLNINGTVNVELWSAMKDFQLSMAGEVTVFLRDYNGSTHTEICNGTLTDADWQGGSGTWVQKTISFTCSSYTIPAGNFLEVKLVVGSGAADAMWFAYDTTTYGSRVQLPLVGSGAGETEPNKHQAWRTTALGAGLNINGTVHVHLWSAMQDFSLSTQGSVTVFLRDYNGASYTEICQASLTDADWQGGSGTWVLKTISFTCGSYTIPTGNFLEVKLIVNTSAAGSMWFAYDTTSYDSRVLLP